ncbi:hypothetical protein SAMN05444279_1147 [Ruegeria intermedia]|uniref:Chemotaxis protein n=1 Tax=Ruegeria intermedia TaxID=996115 RepID=A0A1M4Y537_9RHOB|nr:hypothetical protein [Ruegeria intermedia]SHF00871.1 hypothetical protein SAMN05444279_1147 [Ruegeria intermedia]
MKLLLRQHLESMKERDGLDVLLPQLLSELGYEVIHRPRIGGRQAGVDVAAVGPDPDTENKKSLLLFVIKSGNVGRADWDGSLQAVRPSLGEVIDDYIPNRIPEQFRGLPITVCVCMGGEIEEGIRAAWRGFVNNNTRDGLSFREWNGDRIANLILSGVLTHQLLPPTQRANFQKAIALVSEPDESYQNFRALLDDLSDGLQPDQAGTTRLRQMMICLWILVTSGFDAENLDAPYRACELAMLHVWDAVRQCPERKRKRYAERWEIFQNVVSLYLSVGQAFLVDKIGPHAGKRFALSAAVQSRSPMDVNLSLFDLLGRLVLLGHWHHAIACRAEGGEAQVHLAKRDELLDLAIQTINNNPTLVAPMRDDHQIEIAMLTSLAQSCGRLENVSGYLEEVANRIAYGYRRRSHWVTCFREYQHLARHPIDRSDAYFRRSTIGSVLVPFVLVALDRLGKSGAQAQFERDIQDTLAHSTFQTWVPHEKTADSFWKAGQSICLGIALGLQSGDGSNASMSSEIANICSMHGRILEWEAVQRGLYPLVLTACRHHRLPVPPQFWVDPAS